LQHSQKLRLHVGRELTYLIQKDRTPVGQLEAPFFLCDGAGETPLLMTEELTLEEMLTQGSTVDGNERPVPALTVEVDRLGCQFLARSAFALDQNRRIGRSHLPYKIVDFFHGHALADQTDPAVVVEPVKMNIFMSFVQQYQQGVADTNAVAGFEPGLMDRQLIHECSKSAAEVNDAALP
jgi:hypothetical protein